MSSNKDTAQELRDLREENKRLRAEIRELKRLLSQTSRNSHNPPSSDGPKRKVYNNRQKSNRKQGAQPGHKGTTLQFSEHPDHKVRVFLDNHKCRCGSNLTHGKMDIERRQVFDLPVDLCFEVTEYLVEKVRCPQCGKVHLANAPTSHSLSYGPQTKALISYLNNYQQLPFQRIQEFFEDVFGQKISDGVMQSANLRQANSLEIFSDAVAKKLTDSHVAHADETGMRCEGKNGFLHVLSNQQYTFLHFDKKRGKQAIENMGLLEKFQGVLVRDRWASYDAKDYNFDSQLCNAHLIRDLKAVAENSTNDWPNRMIHLLIKAKKVKEKGLTNADFKILSKDYDEIIKTADTIVPTQKWKPHWEKGPKKRSKERNLLNVFKDRKSDVLRFISDKNVPFDNNLAERNLRMPK